MAKSGLTASGHAYRVKSRGEKLAASVPSQATYLDDLEQVTFFFLVLFLPHTN